MADPRLDPDDVLRRLQLARKDRAEIEIQYHDARINGFLNARAEGAKTVKEMEFYGDYHALNLHPELIHARVVVASLEDELRVACLPTTSNG